MRNDCCVDQATAVAGVRRRRAWVGGVCDEWSRPRTPTVRDSNAVPRASRSSCVSAVRARRATPWLARCGMRLRAATMKLHYACGLPWTFEPRRNVSRRTAAAVGVGASCSATRMRGQSISYAMSRRATQWHDRCRRATGSVLSVLKPVKVAPRQ